MTFIETPRFPDNISYGSSGGPGFKTHIFDGHTGIEQRNMIWSIAKGRWDVSHGIRDKSDMDLLREFFYMARGRGHGFRFKDHSDYEIINGLIGVGDGSNRVFPIVKIYGSGATTYTRRIFKPISGTLTLTVAGLPVVSGFTADYTLGVITFDNDPADIPDAAQEVRVSCEFDVPARFDIDQMSTVHDGWLTESWSSIPIVELLEEEDLA